VHPFLILEPGGGEQDGEVFATLGQTQARRPARAIDPRAGLPAGPLTRAFVIAKRAGANDYTNMVTVGRTTNNDITIEVASVSKFHAYFTQDPESGRWCLHDAGSSNGTWVDGERTGASSGKVHLRDGAAIQLGPDARTRFFQASALFDLIAVPST
jgi:hypothetical protein